ncbi:MAG: hypothetical protein A3J74_03650 [Elusimicrobia bacterium RIFCSPHIGHO2_02_FULL_57_9]|nr:MAG: hypothetical protein A3J74_03650 [Elusimicrobia bacterium RIFCSPHIGHO2_02_FULL_57_9]
MSEKLLAVIPARGRSKGLPGKNIRPLAGLPLIAHSIRLARLCPEITRCIVSTDSPEIAAVARRFGAELPFPRPKWLAHARTPMWQVLRHALHTVEMQEGSRYDFLLLLDPTSPTRLPQDVARAFKRLKSKPRAAGIVSVSVPEFNPIWHSVVKKNGWMTDLNPTGARFNRRQQAPRIYRINGLLYIWRADFVRKQESWRSRGKHLLHITPDIRAVSIDNQEQFDKTDLLIRGGLINLPWLKKEARHAQR